MSDNARFNHAHEERQERIRERMRSEHAIMESAAIERERRERHHDAVLVFVKYRLAQPEPVTGGELAAWAHLMADYLYPPPGAVFDPPLRHYANPPPKPGEVDR